MRTMMRESRKEGDDDHHLDSCSRPSQRIRRRSLQKRHFSPMVVRTILLLLTYSYYETVHNDFSSFSLSSSRSRTWTTKRNVASASAAWLMPSSSSSARILMGRITSMKECHPNKKQIFRTTATTRTTALFVKPLQYDSDEESTLPEDHIDNNGQQAIEIRTASTTSATSATSATTTHATTTTVHQTQQAAKSEAAVATTASMAPHLDHHINDHYEDNDDDQDHQHHDAQHDAFGPHTSSSQTHNNNNNNHKQQRVEEASVRVIPPSGSFNVVLTHATADFDSLASAVGLAKLWTHEQQQQQKADGSTWGDGVEDHGHVVETSSSTSMTCPTYVILPRGAHPGVSKFLALHRHLFPIRSLKSLPTNLAIPSKRRSHKNDNKQAAEEENDSDTSTSNTASYLNRLALVDAQRRDRLGPAEYLLQHAHHVFVVDHHVDQDSDIIPMLDPERQQTEYVVDKVGSVTTLLVEQLQQHGVVVTEAEATLLALGIHADTGSLCFDSTTPRDAMALAWTLQHGGASQTAIAEHAHASLSTEQQAVLTQALAQAHSTMVQGVTLSTCLLHADGFINGLATVTQDALEMSSSDIFLLAVVYEPQPGGKRKRQRKKQKRVDLMQQQQQQEDAEEEKDVQKSTEKVDSTTSSKSTQATTGDKKSNDKKNTSGKTSPNKTIAPSTTTRLLTSRLLGKDGLLPQSAFATPPSSLPVAQQAPSVRDDDRNVLRIDGEEDELLRRLKLRAAFDRHDKDASGDVCVRELSDALAASGVIASEASVEDLFQDMDRDGNGRVDFEEFVDFCNRAAEQAKAQAQAAAEAAARATAGLAKNKQLEKEKQKQREDAGSGDGGNNKGPDAQTKTEASDKSEDEAQQENHHFRKPASVTLIGRVKAGVNLKAVKLNKLFERLGGGGHPKAASATFRLDPCETVEQEQEQAQAVLQELVEELIDTSLRQQPSVGDFMTAPALAVRSDMAERQVEDWFQRYDVRALPVVDENDVVVGLVTYKEVAAAVKRLENREEKQRKKLQQQQKQAKPSEQNSPNKSANTAASKSSQSKATPVKAWMKQHVEVVEVNRTMAEVERILLDEEYYGDNTGIIPVVESKSTMIMVGMVTRTDLLRQHRYYPSLQYHNKGFADSIAARKPIIDLRKRLKQFDLD